MQRMFTVALKSPIRITPSPHERARHGTVKEVWRFGVSFRPLCPAPQKAARTDEGRGSPSAQDVESLKQPLPGIALSLER
jgi:hypothetical protein